MKVTIQECSAEEEEEVIIRCRGIDERISRLLKALQSDQEKLTVFDGEKMQQHDIIIESKKLKIFYKR